MQKRRLSQSGGLVCFVLLLVVSAHFVGCSKVEERQEPFSIPEGKDLTELVPRMENVATGAVCRIEQMQLDDVIIAVNGYPLTRKMYDEQIRIITQYAMLRPGMNAYTLNEHIEDMKRDFVRQFPKKRLLVDESKRLGLTTVDQVNSNICAMINENARRLNKKPQEVLSSFKGDPQVVLCEMAEEIWINAIVKDRIPPKVKVDEAFVSNVQAQVKADNIAAVKTNELFKAHLLALKEQIEKGERTFEDVAEKESRLMDGKMSNGGFWGEFERDEIDERIVARAAFKLEKGGITEPLEVENGFLLVKVLDVKPPVRNEKGRIIEKERRSLARVYIEKEPQMIVQTTPDLMADLRRQMQARAINEFVEVLATNGNHKVVFPHGTGFFK